MKKTFLKCVIAIFSIYLPLKSNACNGICFPTLDEVRDAVVHNGVEAANVLTLGEIGRNRDEAAAQNQAAIAAQQQAAQAQTEFQRRQYVTEEINILSTQISNYESILGQITRQKNSIATLLSISNEIDNNFEETSSITERILQGNESEEKLLTAAEKDLEIMNAVASNANVGIENDGLQNFSASAFISRLLRRAKSYNTTQSEYLKLIVANGSESENDYRKSMTRLVSSLKTISRELDNISRQVKLNMDTARIMYNAKQNELNSPSYFGSGTRVPGVG